MIWKAKNEFKIYKYLIPLTILDHSSFCWWMSSSFAFFEWPWGEDWFQHFVCYFLLPQLILAFSLYQDMVGLLLAELLFSFPNMLPWNILSMQQRWTWSRPRDKFQLPKQIEKSNILACLLKYSNFGVWSMRKICISISMESSDS